MNKHWIVAALLLSNAAFAASATTSSAKSQPSRSTRLINEPFMVDFSKTENLMDPKNQALVAKIKRLAQAYAKEGAVYQRPVRYESINYVLNPVWGSKKYKHHFRFNLKADDGKLFNCTGIADQKLEAYLAGCYAAAP